MRHSLGYLLLAATATLSSPTFAALGGGADTIVRDQTSMRAQLRATVSNGYTIHELVTESGVAIREYVSAQGVVFGVAWEGPTMPDLQQLLGNYFPQFSQAMAERRSRGIRGPVALKQNDLTIESRGRMRDFYGRAYVPSLLPPQVSIDEIQ